MTVVLACLALLLLALAGLALWARRLDPPPDGLTRPAAMPAPGDHSARGGFTAVRRAADPQAALARLDAVAASAPRTRRRAGSAAAGHAAFVTRSAVFGFPDVSHVWRDADLIAVSGHLVVGKADAGVNRRRILGWLSAAGLGRDPAA